MTDGRKRKRRERFRQDGAKRRAKGTEPKKESGVPTENAKKSRGCPAEKNREFDRVEKGIKTRHGRKKREEPIMYTTRKAEESYSERTAGGVGVLERNAPSAQDAEVRTTLHTESADEAKARMQKNLDMLLHYDEAEYSDNRAVSEAAEKASAPAPAYPEFDGQVYDVQTALQYAAQVKEAQRLAELQAEEEAKAAEQAAIAEAQAQAQAQMQEVAPEVYEEDDVHPTSTTMQFGVGETESVIKDLTKTRESEKSSYKLNAKGKIVVALYAVAVMVILALIVINTGVLASLKRSNAALADDVAAVAAEYDRLVAEIDTVSSDDYVINAAENIYNMVKR